MKANQNLIDQLNHDLEEPVQLPEVKQLTQSPSSHYQAKIIRFCAKDCRQDYSDDPLNSSLASRLLTDR